MVGVGTDSNETVHYTHGWRETKFCEPRGIIERHGPARCRCYSVNTWTRVDTTEEPTDNPPARATNRIDCRGAASTIACSTPGEWSCNVFGCKALGWLSQACLVVWLSIHGRPSLHECPTCCPGIACMVEHLMLQTQTLSLSASQSSVNPALPVHTISTYQPSGHPTADVSTLHSHSTTTCEPQRPSDSHSPHVQPPAALSIASHPIPIVYMCDCVNVSNDGQ